MLEAVALPLIKYALSEDVGTGDITSLNTIRSGIKARAAIVAKQPGIIAGVEIAGMTFREADGSLRFRKLLADGSSVESGAACAQVIGDAGSIFKAERTALNFMQHLSGVATLTRRFPEKYAVKCGGAENHRLALWDMYLVKDNHIRAAGGLTAAIDRITRTRQGDLLLEVEVESLDQLREALRPDVDRILVDNRSVDEVRTAVREVDRWLKQHPPDSPRMPAGARRWPEIEVSGGIGLDNVHEYASTGADYVSVGALTHSAPALDLSLEVEEVG